MTYISNAPKFLRDKLAEDEKFISDRHGYCQDYPQDARVEFIEELLDKHERWTLKAEEYQEEYCNVRANFLDDLLQVIAQNWDELL